MTRQIVAIVKMFENAAINCGADDFDASIGCNVTLPAAVLYPIKEDGQ